MSKSQLRGTRVPQEITYDLITKYEETGNKDYLYKWLKSDEAVALTVRLSNFTSAKLTQSQWGNLYDGDDIGRKQTGAIYPTMMSTAYEVICKMAESWDPDKAKFSTYIFSYGPFQIRRELQEQLMYGDETDLNYDREEDEDEYIYDPYQEDKRKIIHTFNEVMQVVGTLSPKEQAVVAYDLGNIGKERVLELTGYNSLRGIAVLRKKVYDKIRKGYEKF